MADRWHHIDRDGMPACDGETVFVGVNSAGHCACFNDIAEPGGQCAMVTPEACDFLMSELRWWRVLDRPDSGVVTKESA